MNPRQKLRQNKELDAEATVEEEEGKWKLSESWKTCMGWDWEIMNDTKPTWQRPSKWKMNTNLSTNCFQRKLMTHSLYPLYRRRASCLQISFICAHVCSSCSIWWIWIQEEQLHQAVHCWTFIRDDFYDVMPRCLNSAKVDSEDLPLNVSQENYVNCCSAT